jgi:DNA-binding transcriptional ArsR family regulator
MVDPEGDFVGDRDAAFTAVSDPTRIAILRALASYVRETGEAVCRFSELRKRAGVDDSGRFRYHLNKLDGHFVEKGAQGYQLTRAGGEMVAAILAGRYIAHERLGPTSLDSVCSLCGADVVGTYEDGRIECECEGGHPLLSWPLPPNAATGASVGELARLATSLIVHAVDLALQGICSQCYGPVRTRIGPVESEMTEMPGFSARCETCAGSVVGPAWFALLCHPTVETFYHDHGLSVREAFLWELDHVDVESSATDDGEVRLVVSFGEDLLHATLSETGCVLSTRADSVAE